MCLVANEMFRLYPDHLVIAKDFYSQINDLFTYDCGIVIKRVVFK